MNCSPTVCKERLLTMYPNRRELLKNKVDTTTFRFC